jgi:hypothetical protein
MPRVILLHDGCVKQVWDVMIPEEDAIRGELPPTGAWGPPEAES